MRWEEVPYGRGGMNGWEEVPCGRGYVWVGHSPGPCCPALMGELRHLQKVWLLYHQHQAHPVSSRQKGGGGEGSGGRDEEEEKDMNV